jgi:hypothetical protein
MRSVAPGRGPRSNFLGYAGCEAWLTVSRVTIRPALAMGLVDATAYRNWRAVRMPDWVRGA